MTVVAAIRLHGTPVLTGDLLLTSPAAPGSERFLEPVAGDNLPRSYYPVNPRAAAQLPDQIGYRVAGTRRKVLLINDCLCVAWSGSALGAAQILRQLRSQFGDNHTSKQALTEFLSKQDSFKDTLGLHLIGWLLDEGFHCFRWNSEWPAEIFEGDEQIEGSGDAIFQELRRPTPTHVGGNLVDHNDKVQFKAAALISRCIAADVFSSIAIKNAFGYFFEIIYWDGVRFRYVDEMTFSAWRIVRRPGDEKLYSVPTPTIMTYRSYDRFCIVQTYQTAQRRTFVDVVGDGIDSLAGVNPRELGPLSIASKMRCWFFQVTFSDGASAYGPLITDAQNKDFGWVELIDGKENLMVNAKRVYELMAAMHAGH